jgi:hypothetical protein
VDAHYWALSTTSFDAVPRELNVQWRCGHSQAERTSSIDAVPAARVSSWPETCVLERLSSLDL